MNRIPIPPLAEGVKVPLPRLGHRIGKKAVRSDVVFFAYLLRHQFDRCENLKVTGRISLVISIFVTSLHADLGRKGLFQNGLYSHRIW